MNNELCNRHLIAIVLVCLFVLTGCGNNDDPSPGSLSGPTTNPNQDPDIRTVFIRDHKQECEGVAIFPCLYIKESIDANWGFFYDSIEGFKYEWGYNYELKVSVTELDNPPQDASSLRYTLVNQISKTPVTSGTTFEYYSRNASQVITQISDTRFALFPFLSKEFTCRVSQCDRLNTLLAQNHAIAFEFRHADELADALILEDIICSDTIELFLSNCLQSQTDSGNALDTELLLLDKFNQASGTFNQGESLRFQISAINTTSDSIVLEFNDGQRYDIFVTDELSQELWRWSEDKAFTQALETQIIESMETIKVEATWDLVLGDGSSLPSGNYSASAYYHDRSKVVSTTFQVR